MPSHIERSCGPAPTPEEVNAAVRRASELRSEVMHDYASRARQALACRIQRLPVALAAFRGGLTRRGVAPSRTHRQPTWSMLPHARRWIQSLRGRVL